jgi:hypothetical protein
MVDAGLAGLGRAGPPGHNVGISCSSRPDTHILEKLQIISNADVTYYAIQSKLIQ